MVQRVYKQRKGWAKYPNEGVAEVPAPSPKEGAAAVVVAPSPMPKEGVEDVVAPPKDPPNENPEDDPCAGGAPKVGGAAAVVVAAGAPKEKPPGVEDVPPPPKLNDISHKLLVSLNSFKFTGIGCTARIVSYASDKHEGSNNKWRNPFCEFFHLW